MSRATPEFAFANTSFGAPAPRTVALWLLACCALVFAMVVVGGITRLTHSGLSIVEWQPILGTVPPLNEAQWQETFAKYKKTPEFSKRNFDMTLEGFKGIFWWEYIHRLLGRLIGLVFLVPFLWFLFRGKLARPFAWKLAGIFALGGLQGFMGWYMVASGLVDDPRVSQFRLTAHLTLAFLIYAAMFWLALDVLSPGRPSPAPSRLRTIATGVVLLVFAMVVTGGLVAGIRAGYAYNTFPLMNGHVIPPEILMLEPWWKNLGYNMATVQFDHRVFAWVLAFLVPWLWFRVRAEGFVAGTSLAAHALLLALAIQIALGISTLLLKVPVELGTAHQGGAVVVLTAALWLRHCLR